MSTTGRQETGDGAEGRPLVVVGASGSTGAHLLDLAVARGYAVHAIVRNPAAWDPEGLQRERGVTTHRGDVLDTASMAAAIPPGAVVVSALGARSRRDAGVLTAGARAVLATEPSRLIWLGAMGTGTSSGAVGGVTHRLLRAGFGAEYDDKVTADGLVLAAGGTVVHAGPLSDKDGTPHRAVRLDLSGQRRLVPRFVPRQAVAQVMLDCVQDTTLCGETVLCERV